MVGLGERAILRFKWDVEKICSFFLNEKIAP